jgi:multicomponent Na+:H+ antiporter subunit F
MAFIMGRTDFLDLALAYALINFIGVLAVLWFVQESRKRHPSERNAQTSTESNPE